MYASPQCINIIGISWCVPFNFKPSWFTWRLLMAYSKAKLKSNGDRASPCFKPFSVYVLRSLNTQPVHRFTVASRWTVFAYCWAQNLGVLHTGTSDKGVFFNVGVSVLYFLLLLTLAQAFWRLGMLGFLFLSGLHFKYIILTLWSRLNVN